MPFSSYLIAHTQFHGIAFNFLHIHIHMDEQLFTICHLGRQSTFWMLNAIDFYSIPSSYQDTAGSKDIAHQLEPSVTIRLVESVGKQISKSLSPFRNF